MKTDDQARDVLAAPPSPPRRWHGALIPFGERSAGGVVIWHPDHEGVPGAELPAGARVPVDLAAGPVPLSWHSGLNPGDPVRAAERLGEVEAAWMRDGVLHVLGSLDLAVAGLAEFASAAVLDERETGRRLSLKAVFAGLTYPERDGNPDYFTVTGWRLRGVELGRPGLPGWAPPAGEIQWIPDGHPDPEVVGVISAP